VKRAIDKAGSLDLRAKQKTLALQEQVKQGWAGAEHAEKEAGDLDTGMGSVETRLEAVRFEVETTKGEYRAVKEREEAIRENERKTRAEEEKKLADVVGKVEKSLQRKERREAERAELIRRLEDLDKEREEVGRKNEVEKQQRRQSSYWWESYGAQYGHDHGRSVSAHPSLNNMAGQYAAGPAYRPRGAPGYQPRYPSAGARSHGFPVNNTPTLSSPALRPSASSPGRPAGSGVNVAALPFHPSSQSFDQHHTTLMPPHLQHRIYLPNVRPRPVPNFHPPPSVMAEQRASPTLLSPPSFPPLPGTAPTKAGNGPPGPSLASIVTRAVLSPTSTLTTNPMRPPPVAPLRSPSQPVPILNPPTSPPAAPAQSSRIAFAPAPQKSDDQNFPPLSPTGPWSGFGTPTGNVLVGSHMVRTGTPPWSQVQEVRSPTQRSGSGSGGGSSGTPSRKNTGEGLQVE